MAKFSIFFIYRDSRTLKRSIFGLIEKKWFFFKLQPSRRVKHTPKILARIFQKLNNYEIKFHAKILSSIISSTNKTINFHFFFFIFLIFGSFRTLKNSIFRSIEKKNEFCQNFNLLIARTCPRSLEGFFKN